MDRFYSVDELMFMRELDALGLRSVWRFILARNPSGGLPYHGNRHLLHVARQALTLQTQQQGHSPLRRRVLGLAGLFHDFNHSGGELTDQENIEQAIAGFHEFLAEDSLVFNRREDRESIIVNVERLIRITEYPYTKTPVTFLEKCLRDADLLALLAAPDPLEVLHGLRQEFKLEKAVFVKQQLKFIERVVFHTDLDRTNGLTNAYQRQMTELVHDYIHDDSY